MTKEDRRFLEELAKQQQAFLEALAEQQRIFMERLADRQMAASLAVALMARLPARPGEDGIELAFQQFGKMLSVMAQP